MSYRHLFIPLLLLLLVTGIQRLIDRDGPAETKPPVQVVEEAIPAENSALPDEDEPLAVNAARSQPPAMDSAKASQDVLARPHQEQSEERGN